MFLSIEFLELSLEKTSSFLSKTIDLIQENLDFDKTIDYYLETLI
jgi:hypothetical protein